MTLTSLLLLRSARSTAAQAARRRRRDLERELSAYSSPADLADLCAMLNRQDDRHTAEVRSILDDQQRARVGAWHLLGGGLPPKPYDQQAVDAARTWTEAPDPRDWRRPPTG